MRAHCYIIKKHTCTCTCRYGQGLTWILLQPTVDTHVPYRTSLLWHLFLLWYQYVLYQHEFHKMMIPTLFSMWHSCDLWCYCFQTRLGSPVIASTVGSCVYCCMILCVVLVSIRELYHKTMPSPIVTKAHNINIHVDHNTTHFCSTCMPVACVGASNLHRCHVHKHVCYLELMKKVQPVFDGIAFLHSAKVFSVTCSCWSYTDGGLV